MIKHLIALLQGMSMAGLLIALIAGIFVLDILTPLGVVVWILYLIPLGLTLWVANRRATFLVAGMCAVLTVAGFFLSSPGPLRTSIVNRSMMIVTLGAIAVLVWNEKKTRHALSREIGERLRVEEELTVLTGTLERRIEERTRDLAVSRVAALNMMEDSEVAKRAAERAAADVLDLYNRAPCGYHSLDRHGIFVAINDTELRWLGYAREEVVGKLRYTDVLTPDSAQLFRAQFPAFMECGSVRDVEFEMVRKDGTVIPVLLNATAITDAQGGYVSSRSTIFDITDRKRAEKELSKQTTILQSVLNSIGEGVVVADMDGRFVLWNPAAERLLGMGPADVPSVDWSDHYGLYCSDQITAYPSDQLPLARAIRGESVDEAELFVRHARMPRGLYLSIAGRPLKDDMGIQHGGVVVFSDITDRKRAESEINLHAAQLEASNKELEAFSYSVSHDLRAPIRHIDGFADLLEKHAASRLDEKSRRYLGTISESAKRMGRLIDDLLVFSRMGRAEMRRERVSLNRIVKGVIEELQPDMGTRQITWNVGPLPDVEGDRAMLHQVLMNLVANAVKYTSRCEQAAIEIGSRDHDTDGIEVFVRDNGAGFDMQYVHKLFGVFQRLHTLDEFEGTGIGLANVRRIVARHGGRTWAEGKIGAGATFYFSLPHITEVVHGR